MLLPPGGIILTLLLVKYIMQDNNTKIHLTKTNKVLIVFIIYLCNLLLLISTKTRLSISTIQTRSIISNKNT
ncbi:hypothetical protein C1646_713065 [Rhizophagus diaphanus]|nr:hypothetical protein C1646_713065 [Rhizophagus diaphanus] [Rhizophagus sp. MUCL 43196]